MNNKVNLYLEGSYIHELTPHWRCTFFCRHSYKIWEKLFVISFLYRWRDSLRNESIGSPTLLSLFSSSMGSHFWWWEWSYPSETSSRPNSLYPDLVGDMRWEKIKEHIDLIPLIHIYVRTKWKNWYRIMNIEILQGKQKYIKYICY